MSSSDVRDVLNLPDGGGGAGARPAKKQKLSAPRPNLKGLAREVHNLGGDNPIAIVPEVPSFKKRRLASRKPAAKWEPMPFRNSAREDSSLLLRHWRRKGDRRLQAQQSQDQPQQSRQQSQQPPTDQEAKERQQGEGGTEVKQEEQRRESEAASADEEIEDSAFAKFNVQVSIPQYTDDQYRQYLTSDEWTKAETDYLMGLAGDFDLRWPLIWDRYEWSPPATNGETNADGDESKAIVPRTQSRSMEHLKARYYEVAAKMMAVHKPVQFMSQLEFALHETMAHFDPQKEKDRKKFALNALARSKEEAKEEEDLLLEIKRILARSERFNEERRELYHRLDYPHAETDISSFKSSAGLQTLLQNLVTADKSKKRKPLMGPEASNAANSAAAHAQAQETSRRESTGGPSAAPTPTAGSKKGQQQQQQQQPPERPKLTPKEEEIYGVAHHDRLGSGPVFRTEKINKLFSHKSNQQQVRINNVLNELDVPARLAMPTAATTQQYEQLIVAVNSLLDARKVSDKLDAEIKLEEAKKAEREKAQGASQSQTRAAEGTADGEVKADPDAAIETTEDRAQAAEKAPQSGQKAEGNNEEDSNADKGPDTNASDDDAAEVDGKKDKEEKATRAGASAAAHKRSASVLSTVSDKSAKRQKK
jgi:DNA methyltransferase 1-associated protein 1